MILSIAAVVLVAPAPSQSPLEVTSRIMVEQQVASPDGTSSKVLVAPKKVVPGDRVTFVLAYRNTGTQPIADLVLADPLPRDIAYRAAGADSPPPELSVDGQTFGTLAALRVRVPGAAERPATLDDISTVRWRLTRPVPAGGHGQLSFHGIVK